MNTKHFKHRSSYFLAEVSKGEDVLQSTIERRTIVKLIAKEKTENQRKHCIEKKYLDKSQYKEVLKQKEKGFMTGGVIYPESDSKI